MNALLTVIGIVVCALIILACICRVNLMRFGQSKFGWVAVYILWAPSAGGLLIDLLADPGRIEWWDCVGVVGILVHIVLTRQHWSMGAPIYTENQ
jgi:hypothetical protein